MFVCLLQNGCYSSAEDALLKKVHSFLWQVVILGTSLKDGALLHTEGVFVITGSVLIFNKGTLLVTGVLVPTGNVYTTCYKRCVGSYRRWPACYRM